MKKILALTLSGMLVLGGALASAPAKANVEASVVPQAEARAGEQVNLYLVPGTYTAGGNKIENVIASGAEKLSANECAAIFTENVYACTLSKGATLPKPTSDRTDKDGNAYTFNGWWSIVDATVTYFETVPEITETTYLYADWRADLSQRKDPVIPEDYVEVEPNHYMTIQRGSDTQKIVMRKANTSMSNAETLGYKYPVELVAEGFELQPGDVITVYTTGLTDSEDPVVTPLGYAESTSEIQLETSGESGNRTSDYLRAFNGSKRQKPSLTYIAEESGVFNIYIKYFAKGSIMAVYMEPKV